MPHRMPPPAGSDNENSSNHFSHVAQLGSLRISLDSSRPAGLELSADEQPDGPSEPDDEGPSRRPRARPRGQLARSGRPRNWCLISCVSSRRAPGPWPVLVPKATQLAPAEPSPRLPAGSGAGPDSSAPPIGIPRPPPSFNEGALRLALRK